MGRSLNCTSGDIGCSPLRLCCLCAHRHPTSPSRSLSPPQHVKPDTATLTSESCFAPPGRPTRCCTGSGLCVPEQSCAVRHAVQKRPWRPPALSKSQPRPHCCQARDTSVLRSGRCTHKHDRRRQHVTSRSPALSFDALLCAGCVPARFESGSNPACGLVCAIASQA